MKKTTSLILGLLFSAVMLVSEAINTNAAAALCCDDLSGCGATECCSGAGTPTSCTMVCESGTTIVCPKKEGGGGEEEILQ